MNMRSTLIGLAALAWSTLPAFADPSGTYAVKGHNPEGGDSYEGTVTVSETGKTYHVVWKIGGDTFVGTGIGDDDFLAVSYKSGGQIGLALYAHDGAKWKGVWTYYGSRDTGTEVWMAE